MKRLLAIVFTFIIVLLCTIGFMFSVGGQEIAVNIIEEDATISEDSYIPSETIEVETVIVYAEPEYSVEQLRKMMEEQKIILEDIHNQANNLRMNGYTDESIEIQNLKNRWNEEHEIYLKYEKEYQEKWINSDEFWTQKEAENPTGTYVWKYLKNLGYSDAVCAGIFGNMMLECGIEEAGGFDLKWWKYDSSQWFYGICQWSKTYFPEVHGADLDGQLNCLRDTIQEQIDEAGFAYGGDGFGYEEFLKLEDPAEVAVCFAKAYERCASQHVWPRRGFAEQAYAYFTN